MLAIGPMPVMSPSFPGTSILWPVIIGATNRIIKVSKMVPTKPPAIALPTLGVMRPPCLLLLLFDQLHGMPVGVPDQESRTEGELCFGSRNDSRRYQHESPAIQGAS